MSTKPNIVYILADDMGYGDISCLNAKSKIRTVNLDLMAAGGMKFTDAHSSSAVCTPSRYSIMTGRYNWRSWLKKGVTDGLGSPVMDEDRATVAGYLRDNGYATGCVGKWHLGLEWEYLNAEAREVDFTRPVKRGPISFGFDYFFGISASLDMAPYVYIENDRITAVPDRVFDLVKGKKFMRNGPIAPDFDPEEVLPKFTEKAVAFINKNAKGDKPFFLYFPLNAPHTPILPTPEYRGKSGTNEYGDFCLQVDGVVGNVMKALEDNGIAENTIIAFTADNGCSPMADFSELAAAGHNPSYVFRGHKADIYEGGHRIPLIVRWPQTIPAGSASNETVCLCDLFATCADIVGVPVADNAAVDSVSNLPVWRGDRLGAPLREATVHHSVDGAFSIRQGRWKLEMCPGSGGWSDPKPGKEPPGSPPIQLYDLAADIGERVNVQDRHPEIVRQLTDLLTKYVVEGRSTPGRRQENTGGHSWEQLWWITQETQALKKNGLL
jgi:arylsulfatase A-like enzyme